MFLVTPDLTHGLVAAPQSFDDRTPTIEAFLAEQEFAWNDEIEAFTRDSDKGCAPADVDTVAIGLRERGQFVFSTYTPKRRA